MPDFNDFLNQFVTPPLTPAAAPDPMALLRQANAIPDAQPRHAAFRTHDLIGLLGALALGNQGGNFAGGYLQGKENRAQERTQMDQQAVNRQRQGLYQQADEAQRQQGMAAQAAQQRAKMDFDASQGALDRTSRESMNTADNVARTADVNARLSEQKTLKDAENARLTSDAKQKSLDRIYEMYGKARTLPEMQAHQKRINALAGPDGQLDDASVLGDYHERQRQFIATAGKQIGDAVNSSLNNFGEIDPQKASQLKAYRTSLAKAYGIDEKALPDIPTGQSLKAKALADRQKDFERTFGQRQDQFFKGLQLKVAGLDLARQRLQYAQSHGDAMLGVAQGNQAIAAANLQLRQAAAGVKDDGTKAIKKIDQQIRGLNVGMKGADDATRKRLQTQKSKLIGQREFLVNLLPEELQGQDVLAQAVPGVPQVYQRPSVNPVTSGSPSGYGGTKPGVSKGGGLFPIQGPIGGGGQTRSGTKYRVIQ